ncbi:hypothetical protein G3I59_28110 [Amycolatopsis rubida]|uniref:Uncharacterized protein n=1 Tax=Amycolatopsis rubida TaxID=112413 RepID=A0A1I5V5C6_9PSEU|nr:MULTISPECIES: hypothetical protein [Amycolatopsis]MYW94354.1 hypothetical protein [Amycolatopsis rubida]NEC59343.1 hypothetical protein [Amycolatopsis rubida]OAP26839.1 hypothetical protein A4R44_02827 [Amycolatopsis sp. M39]SFQ02136.1 hypothetical protein SAMN05421854_108205 [Amycolatopsis rubida]
MLLSPAARPPEAAAAHLWSPLKFVRGAGPGADPASGVPCADATGRTTPTSGMPVGEMLPFVLEPTTPPTWPEGQTRHDRRRARGTVLRLSFLCRKDNAKWTLAGEIDIQTTTR